MWGIGFGVWDWDLHWDGGCGAWMWAIGLGCWVGIEARMWDIGLGVWDRGLHWDVGCGAGVGAGFEVGVGI